MWCGEFDVCNCRFRLAQPHFIDVINVRKLVTIIQFLPKPILNRSLSQYPAKLEFPRFVWLLSMALLIILLSCELFAYAFFFSNNLKVMSFIKYLQLVTALTKIEQRKGTKSEIKKTSFSSAQALGAIRHRKPNQSYLKVNLTYD